MNFFEHQDQARKKTGLLLGLFILAVITLIAMTIVLVMMVFSNSSDDGHVISLYQQFSQTSPIVFYAVTFIVLAVVGGASLYKLSQLSAGGKVVAEMLGGTLVNGSSADPDERKLLNVIEEMAIASGSPVPPAYLLPDNNINAFAAGFNFNDAVIGVTRGCIEQLNRDELQGVIAHEFSHIFHGDMRINIRLIGMLHGILVIGLIGKYMLNSMRYSTGRNKNGGAALGLGIGLIVVGFGGLFFGNLIKSAVSRQREYLADASAVKFTRNPDGIAGALKKIGGFKSGARLEGEHVGEMSHLFFGEAVSAFFATHPPLDDRIKRIQPSWNGKFTKSKKPKKRKEEAGTQNKGDASQQQLASELSSGFSSGQTEAAVDSSLNQIGDYKAEHIAYAKEMLHTLPDYWHQQARTKLGARAVIYALLLEPEDENVLDAQYVHIAYADNDALALSKELAEIDLDTKQRLPLIEIALPQLAKMDKEHFSRFKDLINRLIRADKKISLSEWMLYTILMHYLKPLYKKLKQPKYEYRELEQVSKQCATMFSILAVTGQNDSKERVNAFNSAVESSGLSLNLVPTPKLNNKAMTEALRELNKLYPLVKPKFLKACIACICADGEITATEAELIRAISDTLDCPMPPILM